MDQERARDEHQRRRRSALKNSEETQNENEKLSNRKKCRWRHQNSGKVEESQAANQSEAGLQNLQKEISRSHSFVGPFQGNSCSISE